MQGFRTSQITKYLAHCQLLTSPPWHWGWSRIAAEIRAIRLRNSYREPCLVWLSGLSASLGTKGSLVQFLVRAHAWVLGQVPSGGAPERQPRIDVSLPLVLPPFSSL